VWQRLRATGSLRDRALVARQPVAQRLDSRLLASEETPGHAEGFLHPCHAHGWVAVLIGVLCAPARLGDPQECECLAIARLDGQRAQRLGQPRRERANLQ
jgi:hypothetical protein